MQNYIKPQRRIFPSNIEQCKIDKFNKINKLIVGKSYREAEKIYGNLRIVKQDDKCKIITLDYCEHRCNVEIKNEIIIKINGFY
jgi:hypothetical protein